MADPQSTSINPVNDIQARQFIQLFTDSSTAPVLASGDLDQLIAISRRQDRNIAPPDPYVTWQPSTAYVKGANVVADPRNGSYFTAQNSGTSGATQPTWPTTTNGTVIDGGVTWQLAGGAPWQWTWKLSYGVKMGWEVKLARIATVYDFSAGDQKLSRHQLFQNFKEMCNWWGAKAPEQFKLMGSLRDRALFQNMRPKRPGRVTRQRCRAANRVNCWKAKRESACQSAAKGARNGVKVQRPEGVDQTGRNLHERPALAFAR